MIHLSTTNAAIRFRAIELICFGLILMASSTLAAQSESDATPVSPRLLIHGGGRMTQACIRQFVQMAGGADAHLVVIPTATSDSNLPTQAELEKRWSQRGIGSVALLHTRNREKADDEAFLQPLQNATAIWIGGGAQSRLSEAYSGTLLEKTLLQLSRKGVVIGGSSAGAAIQSQVMIQSGRQFPTLGTGFDLLPNAIIDQHFLKRSRFNRLARALDEHPQHTGVGIDEATCLVVEGDKAKVVGDRYIVVLRKQGDRLDVKSFSSGDEFSLLDLNLARYPNRLKSVPGISELVQRRESFNHFLLESAQVAESFRARMNQTGPLESPAKSLAKLTTAFQKAHDAIIKNDPHAWRSFRFSESAFVDGFAGLTEPLDGATLFEPFAGEWFGRWEKVDVDHHWSHLCFPEHSMLFEEDPKRELRRTIEAFQYVWIGDGYGVNLISKVQRDDYDRHYLLGYVEHLQAGDFSQITARRPHVGIPFESGKLIWVTPNEVFFEETFPATESRNQRDSYSIIGFRYSVSEDKLMIHEGFQTMYNRDPRNRKNFRKFPLDIEIQREVENESP